MCFFDGLEAQTTNPLFLGGAALLSGEGFKGALGGFQAGQQMQEQRRKKAEEDAQKQRWEQYAQSPQFGQGLPDGAGELMRAAGPGAAIQLASGIMTKQADNGLEMARIAEQKRFHDSQIWNMTQKRKLQEQEVQRRNTTADFQNNIMRSLTGGTPNAPQQPQTQTDPNIRLQSNETVPDGDPMLIQAQAVAPSQVPQQAQAPLIDTPYGKMTVEKARQTSGQMMMIPHMATAGKALFDSIPSDKFGKEATNKIEEKQFNSIEQLTRLNAIKQQYKPAFQTIENRLGYAWTDLLSKFSAGQANVTPQQAAELGEFAAFKADTFNNLSNYIKEITGAAMTDSEAKRIMQGMPNPGTGVFDGDSPVAFEAKMKTVTRNVQLSIARYNYLRQQGPSAFGSLDDAAKHVPLEKMNGIIQKRTNEITREIQTNAPGMNLEQLKPLIKQRLRTEFGISA